jgi:dTDP-4-dehydrorhamnose 3,5-epimerase
MAEVGIRERFVQDNHSFSRRNVIRGLHYQVRPQGKLVRVGAGEILDVAVDLRRSSPNFGAGADWSSLKPTRRCCGSPRDWRMVSESCRREPMCFTKLPTSTIPRPNARSHGMTRYVKIDWRLSGPPILSDKDRLGASFREAEVFQ